MTARVIGRTGKVRGVDRPVSELLRVGSGAGNELRIDSRTVSRQHLQVVKVGEGYYVEDLGSRNGSFLNGQRVKRFPIRHLDVVSLGPDVDLIFLETGAAMAPVARPTALRASIAWTDGPCAGRVEEISADRGLLLGRQGALDAVAAISRRHAAFTIRGDRVTVEDLGSANGTEVNGVPISVVTPLADGDEVSLANLIRCRVSIVSGQAVMPEMMVGGESETIAVERPASLREPVLDVLRSPSTMTPPATPTPPVITRTDEVRAVPTPVPVPTAAGADTPTTTAPRDAAVRPPDSVGRVGTTGDALLPLVPDAATIAAPRGPAIAPPQGVGAARTADSPAPQGGDATMAAPREAAVAPGFSGPGLFRDAPEPPQRGRVGDPGDATFAQPAEPAGAVPNFVVAAAMAARDAIDATVSVPQGPPPAASPRPPTSSVTPTPMPAGSIVGLRLEGPQDVTLNRGTFLVGRHSECDVRLDLREVGRRHARLHVREDAVSVEDLGTENGTFVNDVAVTGESVVPDRSRLRFATVEFAVTCLRSEGQT